MIEKLLAILFSLLIFAQAWGMRRLVGTWIFPASLFGLFWFAYTIIPLLVLPAAPVEPLAIGYLLLCCLAYSASAVSFDWKQAFTINRNRVHKVNYGSVFLRRTFYVSSAFALIGVVANWFIQGFTLYDILFDLLQTSGQYMAKRYSDELVINPLGQVGVIFTYVSAIIGGYVYGAGGMREKSGHVLVVSLLPSILVMLVEAAKGTFFLALVFFWSGILSCKINQDDLQLFRRKTLSRIILCSAVLFPILVFSFIARGIDGSEDSSFVIYALARYFVSYTSGHLYAFSDWFSHLIGNGSGMGYRDDFGTAGFYTFMSIFKVFGSSRFVPPGVYDEYFSFDEILTSNIYTMFRGLIVDFGIVGSIFFMLAFGLFSHVLFLCQLTSRRPSISPSVFSHIMGFIYTSFIISLLIWNSVYASFVVVSFVLFLNNKITSRNGAAKEI